MTRPVPYLSRGPSVSAETLAIAGVSAIAHTGFEPIPGIIRVEPDKERIGPDGPEWNTKGPQMRAFFVPE